MPFDPNLGSRTGGSGGAPSGGSGSGGFNPNLGSRGGKGGGILGAIDPKSDKKNTGSKKGDDKLEIIVSDKTKLPGAPLSIGKAVDAPSQIVRHAIKGAGEVATGDFGEAWNEFGRALVEIPTLGQGGKDITFTESLEPYGVKKLPYGLETAGSILTDPFTYVTAGTGAAGRAGLQATKAAAGSEARAAVRKGGLKALTKEEQSAVRSHILEEATKTVGEKKAKKVADTQMQALKSRARGGIGLHVPGTKLDVHVAGKFSHLGESLATRSPKYRAARALFSEADLEEEARLAKNLSRRSASDVESMAQKAGRLFDESELGGKINTKIASLSSAPTSEPGTFHKLWRRAAISYPGTVVNRLRQAAFYGAAEGMRPDQWLRYMARGRKNYAAYNAVEESLGLTDEFPEFVTALEQKIGKQAAQEEIAFRRFAAEPTYFSDIEQRAPKSSLGRAADKARLIKHGGRKIREAGTAVEESSRRANFLFNLENRYGNFEQAGARTRYVLPGVRAVSEAERKIAEVLPFWTAMRADWQSVLRLMGESPGRVSALTRAAGGIGGTVGLPGGGTIDLSQLKDRHMPPLELAKALNIPLDLAQGELNLALLALSDMTGGPLVTFVEQLAEAWLQQQRNPNMPKREMWYRFLKEYAPYLQRLPSAAETSLAGKDLSSSTDKSGGEALLKFVTGLNVKTDTETTGTAKKSSGGGLDRFAPKK